MVKSPDAVDDETVMGSSQPGLRSFAKHLLSRLPGLTVVRLFALACVSFMFLLSLLLGNLVISYFPGHVSLTTSALVLAACVVGLFLLGAFAREVLFWRRSCRALAKLMNELRAGEAPIAELEKINGGARIFVEPVRAILLDIREQKRQYAALQEEVRRRILSRTDALERQLGSFKAQASRDGLTGLNNRRAFDAMVPQIFKACVESCEDLCVLMIDVDNFKALNDTLGHGIGDELLKSIAEIILSSIREHDSAYRLGGDEFLIAMPRSSRVMGEKLAARLASLVEHLVRPRKLPLPPALSIGVAALSDQKMRDAKQLTELADHRLYEVKQTKPGRRARSA